MKRTLLFFGAVLLLAGCVDSPEYGELWSSGSVDTNMVGRWQGGSGRQEHIVTIGIVSNAYKVHITTTDAALGKTPATQYSYSFSARDVLVGTNTFMLSPSFQKALLESVMITNFPVASSEHGEATLLRYSQNDSGFTFQYLNCPTVQALIDEGLIEGKETPPQEPGVRHTSTPYVSRFDHDTLEILCTVFNKPESWHNPIEFKRQDREHNPAPYPEQRKSDVQER
jgi:hypothetical protein